MVLFAGLDIHKEFHNGCIMDEKGVIVKEARFSSSRECVLAFFAGFDVKRVVFESTGFWWSLYELLESVGLEVVLAHPFKVKCIAFAKLKNDKIDARMLAHLLRADLVPESFIPSKEMRALRQVTRHRANLVRTRVVVKNKIKAYLLREGIKTKGSYIFSETGKRFISQKAGAELKSYYSVLDTLDSEIKIYDAKIKAVARNRKETSLLLTIPGVGHYSALLIFAEISNIKRFSSAKKLISFAGLAPMRQESAGKGSAKLSHQCCKIIKGILTEIVGVAIKYPGRIQRHYYEVQKKKGWRIARISTARYMLSIMWSMLANMQPYKS